MYEKGLWFPTHVHRSCDIWPSLAPEEPLTVGQQNTAVVLSSSQVWDCETVWMQSSSVQEKKDDAGLAENPEWSWESRPLELWFCVCSNWKDFPSIGKKLIFGSVIKLRVRQVEVIVKANLQEIKVILLNVHIPSKHVCVTDPDCTPGSPRRSTWHRGSWTCRCACFLQTPASSRSLSPLCGGIGRSHCLSELPCTITHRSYTSVTSDRQCGC